MGGKKRFGKETSLVSLPEGTSASGGTSGETRGADEGRALRAAMGHVSLSSPRQEDTMQEDEVSDPTKGLYFAPRHPPHGRLVSLHSPSVPLSKHERRLPRQFPGQARHYFDLL